MIKATLREAVQMIDGAAVDECFAELCFRGVSTDSRSIADGCLFIPLIGEKFDGHRYVNEALERGAAAALWQRNRGEPTPDIPLIVVDDTLAALQELASAYRQSLPVRVIGVTGSNGKTTTKDMVASILATTYKVHKTKGNLNNHIGLPLTLLQLPRDTEMAVIEMGMSGRGEIGLLSRMANPEIAIVTNIGESHLLQLGSRLGIAEAKLEILTGMKSGGLLIYNGDEPLIERCLAHSSDQRSILKFRFGEQAGNDFFPVNIMLHSEATLFKLNTPHSPVYTLPLCGRHNVLNAMAAIAAAKYMGVNEEDIVAGLERLEATGMRTEIVKGTGGMTILNDAYNASPSSMKAAIRLLVDIPGFTRRIAVLGDMLELGENEIGFHREIGQMIDAEKIDYVFTFGKLASYIAEEADKRFPAGRVMAFEDKEALFKKVRQTVRMTDIVLVKGSRGMKMEEIVINLMQDAV